MVLSFIASVKLFVVDKHNKLWMNWFLPQVLGQTQWAGVPARRARSGSLKIIEFSYLANCNSISGAAHHALAKRARQGTMSANPYPAIRPICSSFKIT
jgi:hypothetical protein